MKKKQEIEKNPSTEQQILNAARKVFTQKGYAATRTRDIAEESGFNLALINYYFRSKEKLFDMIMLEHLQTFVHSVMDILNDRETTLPQKIELLVGRYIDMLIQNPDLPIFILSEVGKNPGLLMNKVGVEHKHMDIYIVKQWQEMVKERKMPPVNPIHMLMNILGMTVFPFAASPLLRNRTGISVAQFNAIMEERKKLIPQWMNAIMMSHMK